MPSVTLQDRRTATTHLHLWASIEADGSFTVNGLDLGLGDSDFEYEWITRVAAPFVPALRVLLGVAPTADLLAAVQRDWAPIEGFGLERKIRASSVPSSRWVH